MLYPDLAAYDPLTLMGRCLDGFERDHGQRYHAVPRGQWKALCGTAPGKRSAGWSPTCGEKVTCPRCLKRLAAKAEKKEQA